MPFIETSWWLLCITFGLMLILTIIKRMLSHYFYTMDVVKKKFSIMDMQIPATQTELANLIKGLYKLPEDESRKSIRAVRWQIAIDFLFMPCVYGTIFILCMLVASKMKTFGVDIFIVLAWLQIVPWICDIVENIYLLQKIKPHPVLSTPKTHRLYLFMEFVKWSLALLATICSLAALCYFWLGHNYSKESLHYGLIIIGEIVGFLILGKLFIRNREKEFT